MEGVQLEFDPFALEAIVKKALARKTGARALRSIVEGMLIDIMYELPGMSEIGKVVITADSVEKGEKPVYIEAERKTA